MACPIAPGSASISSYVSALNSAAPIILWIMGSPRDLMCPCEDIPGRHGLPGPIAAADFNRNFCALAIGRVCEVGAVSLYNEWERPYNRRAAPAPREHHDHAASR